MQQKCQKERKIKYKVSLLVMLLDYLNNNVFVNSVSVTLVWILFEWIALDLMQTLWKWYYFWKFPCLFIAACIMYFRLLIYASTNSHSNWPSRCDTSVMLAKPNCKSSELETGKRIRSFFFFMLPRPYKKNSSAPWTKGVSCANLIGCCMLPCQVDYTEA